jgi:catechol 2,3-dioxygenase-like lactoylglutathione lyase family enzyme
MTRTSWVEICVSDFEQSLMWFEQVLGFRVVARDANDYAELSRGETFIQLAADHAPYWESERPNLLPPGQRGSGVEIVLLVENADAVEAILNALFHLDKPFYTLPQFTRRLRLFKAERGL